MRYNSDSPDIIEIFEILWKSVINYVSLLDNAEIRKIFAEIREILLKLVRYYRIYDKISHKFPKYLANFNNNSNFSNNLRISDLSRISVIYHEFH